MIRTALWAALVLVWLIRLPALANTTGTLTGRLLDQTGRPVAGASVTALSESQRALATTDLSGFFVFVSLQPGTYALTIQKSGYRPVAISGVLVQSNASQTVGSIRVPVMLREISIDVFSRPSDLVENGQREYLWRLSMTRYAILYDAPNAKGLMLLTIPGVTLAKSAALRW